MKSRLSYLVEEIDGNALCDDYFGTDENCVALTTMKERLKNSGTQFEFYLWRFISSFINLLTQIKVKNLWIEDLSGSNFIARVITTKGLPKIYANLDAKNANKKTLDFSDNPFYSDK